ncbi:MAG: helix-turn-helix domain-containing protein [Gemmatimonadaceae bacterium]
MVDGSYPTCLERGHFFGVNRLERQVAGFLLSETHYPGGLEAPPHLHPLPYFGFLLAGGYLEQLGRRAVSFAPRSFVFHPARAVHFGRVGEAGARLLHVEITPTLIDHLREEHRLPDESIFRRSGPLASLSHRLYRELRHGDAASELVVEGVALEIVGELVRAGPRTEERPRWLERARERVHAEPSRPLSVQSVAAEVGVSPVRLSRAFRRAFGESLGSYHRRLRVREACGRLRDDALSLAEIALAAGFTDQSHFTRVFRRLTGTTPAAFRREHARAESRHVVGGIR